MRRQMTHGAIALSAVAAIALPAVALAGVHVGGAGAQGARGATSHIVILKNIRFHPSTLAIRRGESVTWLWRDEGVAHNVTASAFHSRTQTNGSFTVRFTHAGTFAYRCTIHAAEGMRGKVIVH
ncbi:MAG TPA: plastocyanin/azurin family copper-binding protein [Solirubrobacteraceae bacterium]|jgi:plastocyanin|nr:plastocyanin/azurin family copper-binding protein [Solirubrobacteraceae bacterium]